MKGIHTTAICSLICGLISAAPHCVYAAPLKANTLNIQEQLLTTNLLFLIIIALIVPTIVALLFWYLQYHSTHKRLKDISEYSQYIVEATPSLIVRMQQGGLVRMVNPAVCKVSGYSEEELLGSNWWYIFHPDGRDDPEVQDINIISDYGRIPLVDYEMTLRTKNGEKRLISWSTANRLFPDGEIKEMVAIGTDITQRRKQVKWEQEESKMRAMAHMSGGLAHEINNALQPILGIADVILKRMKEQGDQKLIDALEILHQNALHARGIVQSILVFSRSDEQTFDMHDASELLNHSIDFVAGALDKHIKIYRHGLLMKKEQTLSFMIYVDQTGITQIMTNLLTNAAHAMDNKGRIDITLDVYDLEDIKNCPSGLKEDRYICLQVKDSGSGIDKETQKKLFEPFFTTKPIGKGTGLGLSTAYGLIGRWGGAISVDSEPGEGATFNVFIPVSE